MAVLPPPPGARPLVGPPVRPAHRQDHAHLLVFAPTAWCKRGNRGVSKINKIRFGAVLLAAVLLLGGAHNAHVPAHEGSGAAPRGWLPIVPGPPVDQPAGPAQTTVRCSDA